MFAVMALEATSNDSMICRIFISYKKNSTIFTTDYFHLHGKNTSLLDRSLNLGVLNHL